MTVYVVHRFPCDDRSYVLGVYSSVDDANKAADEDARFHGTDRECNIIKFEVTQ